MNTDTRLLTLANALREAVAGKSETGRIAAARRVVAALRTVPPRRVAAKRGRKAEHDTKWATDQVLEMVLRDGFPAKRTVLVDQLRDRFIACPDRKEPDNTWLWNIVRSVYEMADSNELDWRIAFRSNPRLERSYGTEEEYITWRKARRRDIETWRADPQLQKQFNTAESYVNAMITARLSPQIELENNGEILPQIILK